MLQYLNKLVNEGLLDPESFTQDDDTARQKLATGKSFVISTQRADARQRLPAGHWQDDPERDDREDPRADRARPATINAGTAGWRTAS